MLDLSHPRIFDLKAGGRHYRMTFRRITDADYRGYYERITSTQQQQGKDVVREFDTSAARTWLVEQAVAEIDGYGLDGVDPQDRDAWAPLLPLRHKLAAADFLLTLGYEKPGEDAPIALSAEECIALRLPLGWSAAEDGSVAPVEGLKHYFRSPTIDQQRRMRLAQSRSVLENGGRDGKTRSVPSQPVAMELYGELIARVQGYALGASPLAKEGPAAIAAAMDGLHKVASVLELFSAAEVGEE